MKKKQPKIQDFKELERSITDYIDFLKSEEFHEDEEDEYRNAIFESAIELYYGEEIWEELNAITGEK